MSNRDDQIGKPIQTIHPRWVDISPVETRAFPQARPSTMCLARSWAK